MLEHKKNTIESQKRPPGTAIILRGHDLTIDAVVRVARYGAHVKLTDDPAILKRVKAAHDYIVKAAGADKVIYGVTTGFGAMANTKISAQEAADLQ